MTFESFFHLGFFISFFCFYKGAFTSISFRVVYWEGVLNTQWKVRTFEKKLVRDPMAYLAPRGSCHLHKTRDFFCVRENTGHGVLGPYRRCDAENAGSS